MEYLCIFLVVLFSIAVIGHGIWVVCAALIRGLFGVPAKRGGDAPAEECPRCSRLRPAWRDSCEWCGLARDTITARELADLAASHRQLKRMLDSGAIVGGDGFKVLWAALNQRHDELLGKPVPKLRPAAAASTVREEELLTVLPADDNSEVALPRLALQADAPATNGVMAAPELAPAEPAWATVIDEVASSALPPVLAAAAAPSVEPPAPVFEAAPPRPPRRSMLELLSAFMEQSNILWGELIGGLLIVVCSIALVISLWPKLEENPAYQFLIFVSVTTMLFGAGLYTFHHWKLEATSRGLLIISTLLVPLNFLAIAAQTKGVSGPLELALELASLVVFGVLLYFTGRVLVPDGRFWFPIAVLGTSASQLLMPMGIAEGGAGSALPLLLLGSVPVLCHLLGCIGATRRAIRAGTLPALRAAELFVLLGTSTFAIASALGLLVAWNVTQGGDVWLTLGRLAIGVALAALPLLAGGVTIQRFLNDEPHTADDAGESAHRLGGLRTAATATALIGMFAMLVSVVLAWPVSPAVLLVCVLNFGVLTYLAARHGMPFAHAAALPCLAVGYLTGFNLLMGGEIAGALLSAENGVALAALVFGLGIVSEVLFRFKKLPHAQFYGVGAGALAVASLLLITLPDRGLDAPLRALVLYAAYGVGALAANARWRKPLLTSAGLALLAAASLWGLWWQDQDLPAQRVPLWSAVLAAEALGLVLVGAFTRRIASPSWHEAYREPALRTAEGMAPLAVLAAFWSGIVAVAWAGEYVVTGGCLAALFLVLAGLERRRSLARVGGIAVIGTAIATAGWVADVREAILLQELSLIAFGLAIAAASMAMAAVMASLRPSEIGSEPRWYDAFTALRTPASVAAGLSLLLAVGTLALGQSPLTTGTGVLLAAAVFLLAWSYDRAALSWIASFLALGAVAYEFSQRFELPTPWPTLAVLTHAALGLFAALALRWRGAVDAGAKRVRLFEQPLSRTAFITSALSLGVIVHLDWPTLATCSLCLLWLAALWLVQSWSEGRPRLFGAFQEVLGVAVLGLTASWLDGRDWLVQHPWGLLGRFADPWSLQTFGLVLGVLSLIWMAVRLALRSRPSAQRLFEPGWPTVDRVMLAGLVLGQLVMAAIFLFPALVRELDSAAGMALANDLGSHAFGNGAWGVLALLGGVLLLGLWDRRAASCILGLAALAVTMPLLIAGPFDAKNAAGLALRWAEGFVLLAASLPVLLRDRLQPLALRWKCNVEGNESLPSLVRATLVAGLAMPILCMTLALATSVIAGQHPLAPDEGTLFFELGRRASNLVPLALVALVLVAYALRERSAGYAFKAGLVVNFAVVVGHAVGFVTQHGGIDAAAALQLQIQLLQLASITASAWALAWIAVRGKWFEGTPSPWLLLMQLGLGAVACGLVLGIAIGDLVGAVPPVVPGWTLESGSNLGWIALLAAGAAGAFYLREQKQSIAPNAAGFVALALVAQFACTIAANQPAWGYRTLMLGCGAYALLAVLYGFWRRAATEPDEKRWLDAITLWVGVAGSAAVLLGLNAAVVHGDHHWAALAIALACPAVATVAVWRRNPSWALVAGFGVNLAASLLVWGWHSVQSLGDWWALLVQANAIASAAVAILWLTLRERLYAEREHAREPLLGVQVCLGVVFNLVLFLAVLPLVFAPGEHLPEALAKVGDTWGWTAWLLALGALGWYAVQVLGRYRGGLAGALVLGIGVLLACVVSRADDGHWQAYHTLAAAAAVAVLAALGEATALRRTTRPGIASSDIPVLVFGAIALLFALRGTWEDPSRPYSSAFVTLAVCLATGLLAVQSRVPAQVFVSGLLVNVAGFIAWAAWGEGSIDTFFLTQALCFGAAAALWAGLATVLHRPTAEVSFRLTWPALVQPFTHLGSLFGLCTLAGLTAAGVFWSLTHLREPSAEALSWWALAAVALPFALRLREQRPWLAREGLYALGLTAIGIALNHAQLSTGNYLWNTGITLAPYMAFTAAIAWAYFRNPEYGALFGITPVYTGRSWFISVESLVALLVAALGVWMSLSPEFSMSARLAGPLATAIVAMGFVFLVEGLWWKTEGTDTPRFALTPGTYLRYAALGLGVLMAAEIGWATLDNTGATLSWLVLHRTVLLMVALALATVLYGVLLPRRLPVGDWADSCRRAGPVLGVAALAVLATIIAQEAWLYSPDDAAAPMAWPAVIVVTLALAGLIAAGLVFAVAPGRDPLGLSEHGRTAYVYAAEVLLVLIFVHLRLTKPGTFQHGIMKLYWPFVLMGIAFLGVFLSEVFERRKLRVLAEPLEHTGVFLPLLPMLAAWSVPTVNYSFVFFSAGLLYGLLSVRKRSFRFALLAALAGNAGLWVMLYDSSIDFFRHPQFWLIPLAVIVLVSEFYNRDRLAPAQSATLRYLGLIVIYVSSTADMFIAGVGGSALYPLILALLSVLGILAGMVMRIRAFLLLGVSFLMLVLLSIIWNAGVNRGQTWILWSAGIALGVAILALFGVFEKRRNDVLQVIENLKQWK